MNFETDRYTQMNDVQLRITSSIKTNQRLLIIRKQIWEFVGVGF